MTHVIIIVRRDQTACLPDPARLLVDQTERLYGLWQLLYNTV